MSPSTPKQAHSRPSADTETDADASANADALGGGELVEDQDVEPQLSAEQDVADSLQEVSAHPFDDIPQDGPLNFDDGTDMGHPRGNTQREGGTWQAEGADSGSLKPPAEILSDRNGPSDRKRGQ